jgi:ParB family chromosome partitioning protein
MREIAGEEVPLTDDEEQQIVSLQEEADALDAQWSQAESVPDEVHLRMEAIAAEIKALTERPVIFEPAEVAIAGAFVSIDYDGSLSIERGYVQPEDEPVEEGEEAEEAEEADTDPEAAVSGASEPDQVRTRQEEEDDEDGTKPLSDRLIAELTAWRTLALQDAIAQEPETAYIAVLHAAVLDSFYHMSRESCLQINVHRASFAVQPDDLRDSAPAQSIAARNAQWEARLPESADELWDVLLAFNECERAFLLAHCASLALNAQAEIVPKYDNGRISAHTVAKRLAHSHVLARAVGLDLVTAGWKPTAGGYFQNVTKTQIIADVTAARGPEFAGMIDHLKKGDMAREAEKLLDDSGWLPEILRTPVIEPVDDGGVEQASDDGTEYAVAAE